MYDGLPLELTCKALEMSFRLSCVLYCISVWSGSQVQLLIGRYHVRQNYCLNFVSSSFKVGRTGTERRRIGEALHRCVLFAGSAVIGSDLLNGVLPLFQGH